MIYQFDGFSAQFTRRPAGWIRRITEAVNARANELGIPTRLEWDDEQLAELEVAGMYEELISNHDEEVHCTSEDYSVLNVLDNELYD